MTMPTYAMKT